MKRILMAALLGFVLASAALAEATEGKTAEERGGPQAESKSSDAQAAKEDGEKTVRTPFGYVKKRNVEKPAEPPRPSKPLVDVKVVGDTVKFQRKTPFGTQAWTRQRAELSDDERKLAKQAGVDLDAGSKSVAKPAAAASADKPDRP